MDEEMRNAGSFGPTPDEEINARELLGQDVCSDVMLNSLLGPVMICCWKDDNIDITRFNQQFRDEVKVKNFRALLKSVQNQTLDEDRAMLYDLLERAMADRQRGALGVVRFKRPDSSISQFRLHLYFMGEDASGKTFYGSARDLTQIITLDDYLRLLSDVSTDSIVFMRRRGVEWSFRVVIHGLASAMGLSAEEFQYELNDGRFDQRMEPEVRKQYKQLILNTTTKAEMFSPPFNVIAADGRTIKMQIRFNCVHDESSGVEHILTFRRIAT